MPASASHLSRTIRLPTPSRLLARRPRHVAAAAALVLPLLSFGVVAAQDGGSSGPVAEAAIVGGVERAEPRARRPAVRRLQAARRDAARRAAVGALRPEPATPSPTSAPTTLPAPAVATASSEAAPGSPPPSDPEVNRPPPRPDRAAPPTPGPPPTVSEGSDAVHRADFPDPYVMRANGSWWAFSTQVGLTSVPAMRSDDLLRWEPVGDALGGVPSWAEPGHHWAPSVLPRASTFVLYYTTRHRATGLQCISRAVAVLPQGPYVDRSEGPMICQTARGGSIDPSPFVDADGRAWLLWKSEGTLRGEPTRIWVQELSADGQHVVGPRTELLRRALDWEHPIIEGPSMARVGDRYHLLYSGNRWETASYAVGHAVCETVTGPCHRTSPAPVLTSRRGAAGPGGQELLRLDDGRFALVHHAWDPAAVGYPGGARMLHLAEVHVRGDRLSVGGAWRDREPSGLLDLGR